MTGAAPRPAPLPVVALAGLEVQALRAELPAPLGGQASPPWLQALLAVDAPAPLRPPAGLRAAVRDVLRQRGYRPTGRGKPSSEYLAAAAAGGRLRGINPVVDAANAVSLHSGLPISVVDLDRAAAPLRIDVAAGGESYVFNQAGQTIALAGLPCLCDAAGPCANAVKDAQRTKTGPATRAVLAIVWGAVQPDPVLPAAAVEWLQRLWTDLGLRAAAVPVGILAT